MSMTLVRKYFVDIFKSNKMEEWKDAFNQENIPSTIINNSFFVELGEFRGVKPVNNRDQELRCSVDVVFFTKGYQTPKEAVDKAVEKSEKLMKDCLLAKNRLSGCVKNVIFNSVSYSPMNSNDNMVVTKMSFEVFTSVLIDP